MTGFKMKKIRPVLTAAILVILTGCHQGTQPKPEPRSLLYAAMVNLQDRSNGFIAIIDCETDLVIDSINGRDPEPEVIASPDGRYFAILAAGAPPYIYDAITRLPIRTLAAPSLPPTFISDAKILLCSDLDSTIVYSMPDFTVLEVWPRPLFYAERVPGRQQVASLERDPDTSKLLFYDYINHLVVDSIITEPDSNGAGFYIMHFTFSADGARFYAIGGAEGIGAAFVGYDVRTKRRLFTHSLYGPFGYLRATPDGQEVWVTDPGYPIEDFPGWPQYISVFDAETGFLIHTVSIRDLGTRPSSPIAAQEIRFTPDGSKAYVNCGTLFKGSQPILVINAQTYHVEKLLYGSFEDRAETIDLAPREGWTK